MRTRKGCGMHQCCPAEWRRTPELTGSYELDAVIARNSNRDIPARLEYYLDQSTNNCSPRTAYNGYHNYSGDS
jgi:hypothetical protein